MTEEWKTIRENTNYEVSSSGNVRHVKLKRTLRPYNDDAGYKKVSLSFKGKKKLVRHVHRLVAIHFIPKMDGQDVVNHKDGNKANYCASNLEWVTESENTLHAFKMNLRKAVNKQKIRVSVYGEDKGEFESHYAAAKALGVSNSYFSCILQGIIKNSRKGIIVERV